MSEQPKELAAKMAAIMGDVPTMIKNGQNVQQKYAYITADDVKAAIRPLLKKHKLAVFSAMLGVERTPGVTKGGGASMTTIAHMRFTLVCADTGESMACDWFGESTDYGDKSVNKAATAAEKYWLINTFLLSTTEPDADEETIEHVYEQPAPHPNIIHDGRYPVEAPGRINKTQLAAIRELSQDLWSLEYVDKGAEYVKRVYGCTLVELTHDEGERMIADLKRKIAEKEAAPA
jgi:hypothetical protein